MAKFILSINGNKSMSYILKTVLADSCKLITVSNAFEAMQILKAKEVGCIIIDIDDQTEQNRDFMQHVKSSILFQCPIIVLASPRNIVAENVDLVFVKPFNPVDLKRAIKEIIVTTPVLGNN